MAVMSAPPDAVMIPFRVMRVICPIVNGIMKREAVIRAKFSLLACFVPLVSQESRNLEVNRWAQ